jgi:hypothetical protein
VPARSPLLPGRAGASCERQRARPIGHVLFTSFRGVPPDALAAGGEKENGDNLVAIHDARIATAYAVEAIGLIDHYRFRVLQQASGNDNPLRLKHHSEHWAAAYFDPTNPKYRERRLFADNQQHPPAQP